MRTFAFIFSFYILFLAVLPSLAMSVSKGKPACCQKTCCHKCKSTQNSKNNQSDNPKGNCTPFFGCSNIQVVVPQTEKSPSINVIYIQKYTSYTESFTSDFYAESWHPPKSLI